MKLTACDLMTSVWPTVMIKKTCCLFRGGPVWLAGQEDPRANPNDAEMLDWEGALKT